ncbi:hypothetical protein [Neorhizobium sp. JUb45]|uniref:hypothetical protein n=1 Tax=unclassified Neorhizobium TaxID=2629175 RepID=UPI0010E4594C|nr:hypothetical protein [Neorhizobium sp. JUb45]TCR02601.1 hypothetical protein EDF70_10325 [Neorhizobium sp. JUb45]
MGKAMMHDNPATFSGVRFTVGRDKKGCWIVQDRDGLVGGIFRDRASAVHFAMFESDHQPGAVCCLPDGAIASGAEQAALNVGSRNRLSSDRPAFRLV